MEDIFLSVKSTKEEVAEFFVKKFKFPESSKDILIKEDISGDVLMQLTETDFTDTFKAKINSFVRLQKYLEENEDKFKENEIKEVITSNSKPEEIKFFFEKCLNFKQNLNELNGKELIELDIQKMIKLGLNLGQRLKLVKYINYFKTIKIDSKPKCEFEITRNSTEEEVANFLGVRLKFSAKSIEYLGLDGETFLELNPTRIDKFNQLTTEEKENLKKYLRGEYKTEEKEKVENEPEIIITNESNEEDVAKFL